MCDGPVSIQRIERQIEALNDQEQDALQLLLRKPSVSVQVVGLLSRVRKDREHLTGVMLRSVATGRSGVRWTELVAEPELTAATDELVTDCGQASKP